MKRYQVRLPFNKEVADPNQAIKDLIVELNDFIRNAGINSINGLREELVAKIESRYNAVLSILGDLYQNMIDGPLDAFIDAQLKDLNFAVKQLENDHLCQVYTGKITCREISGKINSLTRQILALESSATHSISR